MNNESERFTGISKQDKIIVNTRSASVFVHYFQVFGYPGGTRARVVHMASQMNRDVTGCFSFADLNRISNQAYRNYCIDDKH